MQGLRALQIEEAAKDIQKHVEKLAKHLNAYEVYLEKL
jgi:Mg2+ and Co2+ transporter CorA